MSFWTTAWGIGIWAAVAYYFKKSSLAALVAAICAPFAAFIIIHHPSWGWSIVGVSILVIYRHQDNLKRMKSGTELAIGEVVQINNPPAQHNEAQIIQFPKQ